MTIFYFSTLVAVLGLNYLRSYYSEHMNMICLFFALYYFTTNFTVNTIDLIYNRKY